MRLSACSVEAYRYSGILCPPPVLYDFNSLARLLIGHLLSHLIFIIYHDGVAYPVLPLVDYIGALEIPLVTI